MLTRLKRTDDALKWCDKVLQLDESDVNSLCNRGDMHIVKEDLDAAMRDY